MIRSGWALLGLLLPGSVQAGNVLRIEQADRTGGAIGLLSIEQANPNDIIELRLHGGMDLLRIRQGGAGLSGGAPNSVFLAYPGTGPEAALSEVDIALTGAGNRVATTLGQDGQGGPARAVLRYGLAITGNDNSLLSSLSRDAGFRLDGAVHGDGIDVAITGDIADPGATQSVRLTLGAPGAAVEGLAPGTDLAVDFGQEAGSRRLDVAVAGGSAFGPVTILQTGAETDLGLALSGSGGAVDAALAGAGGSADLRLDLAQGAALTLGQQAMARIETDLSLRALARADLRQGPEATGARATLNGVMAAHSALSLDQGGAGAVLSATLDLGAGAGLSLIQSAPGARIAGLHLTAAEGASARIDQQAGATGARITDSKFVLGAGASLRISQTTPGAELRAHVSLGGGANHSITQ